MENEEIQNNESKQKKFVCDFCEFECDYLSDWNRHILRQKHCIKKNGIKMDPNETNINNKKIEEFHFNCENCDKIYKSYAGLWKHKKKCIKKTDEKEYDILSGLTNNEILILLLEQNKKLIDGCNEMNKIITNIL
jgi:hypothetical protein